MNIGVIFSNIFGFDGIIFLVMFGTVWIFIRARKTIDELFEKMNMRVYTPAIEESLDAMNRDVTGMSEKDVALLRGNAIKWYTYFGTATGIFPLLGILGTVLSLLGMVGENSDVTGGFFAALTSTFWGLVFAIIFKGLDSLLAPKLEESERAAEVFMKRKAEREDK